MPKIDKRNLFASILLAIMFGSIFGYMFFFGNPFQQSQQQTQQISNQQTEEPIFDYYAENITAEVKDLLPTLRIAFKPSEFSLQQIVSKLNDINSINSVQNAFFNKLDNELYFIADITIDENAIAEEILREIQEKLSLNEPVIAFRLAIIKLPKQIKITNKDLNVTKDFSFEVPFIETLVTLQEQKGDKIKVNLSLQLQGSKLVNAIAEFLSNESLFFSGTVEKELPAKNINKKTLTLRKLLSKPINLAELKETLESLEFVDSASVSAFYEPIELSIDKDINSELINAADVNGVSLQYDENKKVLKIQFESSVLDIKEKIRELKEKLSIDENISYDKNTFVLININLKEPVNKDFASKLIEKLNSFGLNVTEKDFLLEATFEIESIDYNGKMLMYEQKEFPAVLSLETILQEKQKYLLTINFSASRNNIILMQAIDKALIQQEDDSSQQ